MCGAEEELPSAPTEGGGGDEQVAAEHPVGRETGTPAAVPVRGPAFRRATDGVRVARSMLRPFASRRLAGATILGAVTALVAASALRWTSGRPALAQPRPHLPVAAPPPVPPGAILPTAVPTTQSAPRRTTRTFAGFNEDHILESIRTDRILGREQVGSTSVNLHLRLNGDVDAAFKPRSRSHGEAWRSEIAAFRLNRLLGLERVPPATTRVILASQLHLSAQTQVVVDRDQMVRGAAIFWVPVLRDSRIDQVRERERWTEWLRQRGRLPPESATRAEEISTLIVFDFLIGNWDRWSGSNVPMDGAGHLIYRDNNGGFSEPFGERMIGAVMQHLRLVQRFSRTVVERARTMTAESVRAEMALDGEPRLAPLTDAQIQSLLRRRDTLVAYVDELVRRYGESAVYTFP